MKLIIAGSRTFNFDRDFIHEATAAVYNYNNQLRPTEIVSGTASGVDRAGEDYAKAWNIPTKRFPADWDTYGKVAGPIRNKQMTEYADALLLIWDGKSKGSANMKSCMLRLNKPVYEMVIKTYNIDKNR